MTVELLVVVLADFAAIAALPRVFFRHGSFNRRWMLTALPFAVCALVQVLHFADVLGRADFRDAAGITRGFAALLAVTSVGLITYTVGSHRIPLALWHQDDDAPAEIVTWGPYRFVRHPFYTAFLLALLAGLLATPHPLTLVTLAYGVIAMGVTARREEMRLSVSALGEEYRGYARRVGRFVPKIGVLR